MLNTIRKIIARKCIEGRRPLVATAMEIYRMTGVAEVEQRSRVEALVAAGKVTVGRTFNGIYYKLKEIKV